MGILDLRIEEKNSKRYMVYLAKIGVLLLLVASETHVHAEIQGDSTKNGYGRGKIGVFFKRYFDFRNLGSKSRYKSAEPITSRLTFPFDSKDYDLVFSDEFDSLNLTKWQIGQAWGRVHFQYPHQYYSDSAVQVNRGKLRLSNRYTPKKFVHNDSTYIVPYGVGCINSYHSFSAKYGYFAIRSKNPRGTATWPAFWLTGKHSWPPEIDIFEMYGECDTNEIHTQTMSLHYGSIEGGTKGSLTKKIELPKDTDEKFHVYSCLWEPKRITFYTDGILVKSIRLNRWMRKYFNEEMYIILNNAIDHRYLGCVDSSELPHTFEIDWIRVYTK